MPIFYERVQGNDSFAKYAAAFFNMSRSISAMATFLRNLEFSSISSAKEREPATNGSDDDFAAATQAAKVPAGMLKRLAA